MNYNTQKERIINYYKEIILETIKNNETSKKNVMRNIKKTSLNKKDYKRIYKEIITSISTPKYHLNINQIENIISILSKIHTNIRFDYINKESDPTIYYYINNSMYLINFDSLENKWYLSLLDRESLELVKEIYNDYYENFINYLKNKSH